METKKEEIGFIHEEAEKKLACAGVKGKENAKIVLRCEAKMMDERKKDIWKGILDGSMGMLINEKEFWKEEIRCGFVEKKEWKEGMRSGFWREEWKNGFVGEKRVFESDLKGRWEWLRLKGEYVEIMVRAGERGKWGAAEIRGKDKREWYMNREEVRERIDVREKIRIAERMEIKT